MGSYQKLREEVDTLARGCGRNPADITIVAVTKNYPLDHVLPAYHEGCRDFGENRLQEAMEKREGAPQDLRWHLIGTLQSKKVRKAVGAFQLIHSVDSKKLVERISDVASELEVVQEVLLQVNTSGEASKQGFTPDELSASFSSLASLPAVKILGLMTMAPFTENEGVIRSCFSELRRLRNDLDPKLPHLSMGMSNDYPVAIQEGATILRVGSRLFA